MVPTNVTKIDYSATDLNDVIKTVKSWTASDFNIPGAVIIDPDTWLRMCHALVELFREHVCHEDLDISDEEFLQIIHV